MSSLKRLGMMLTVAAALGIPTTASAFSFDWLKDLFGGGYEYNKPYKPRTPRTPRPERAVPEPTAALLFGLGAAVVAARARKPR